MSTVDKKEASRMAQMLRYCGGSYDGSPCPECEFNSTDKLSDPCVHQLFRKSADIIESLVDRLNKTERAYSIVMHDFKRGQVCKTCEFNLVTPHPYCNKCDNYNMWRWRFNINLENED